MVRFIDGYRDVYGVEPICQDIPIASSTYYAFKARQADASLRSARAKRDAELKPEIQRVWDRNLQVFGAEKVWKQLSREDITADRPNQLWVSDLSYMSAGRGFVYVAFVIDVFSRRIVGWRASSSLRSDLALHGPVADSLRARSARLYSICRRGASTASPETC
jgi:putative transposase